MILSIIIVHYNARDVLSDCLQSLKNSRLSFPHEVFIVDNPSNESIKDLEALYPEYCFLYNSENCGFAAANNVGIRLAKGKYILLLNPDTIVNAGSFQPMIDYLETHPEAGIAGCKIFNKTGEIERSTHSFPSVMKEFVHANEFIKPLLSYDSLLSKVIRKFFRMKSFESYWNHDSFREVDHVTGACMMLKRTVIDQAGMLDEAFFLYNEEVEWSLRIKKAGYSSVFLPDSNIIHLFGHSTKQKVQKQTVNRLLVERYRGMLYFFQKHYGPKKLLLLRLIVFEGFAFRLLINYFNSIFGLNIDKSVIKKENIYIKQIIRLPFYSSYDWRKQK